MNALGYSAYTFEEQVCPITIAGLPCHDNMRNNSGGVEQDINQNADNCSFSSWYKTPSKQPESHFWRISDSLQAINSLTTAEERATMSSTTW